METATPTERKLQEIVARKLDLAPEQVPLDGSLLDDLALDSMTIMATLLEIEDSFAPVTFSERSIADLMTLRDIAVYIDRERTK